MTDLRLERDFPLSPERLFDWISVPDRLFRWWGPEGMTVPEGDLDFSRTGPWYSIMRNDADWQIKVSGQVTHVDPPKSVGLTWAWHDEDGTRGAESHVTFFVTPTAKGARLVIDHRDLGSDELVAKHREGWSSSLDKLSRKIT